MRLVFSIVLCFVLSMECIVSGYAKNDKSSIMSETVKSDMEHFEICKDAQLGIKFYCSSDWKLRVVDNAILIIISSDPSVTLTIAKIDSNTRFLAQLTDKVLKEKDLYLDGFQAERVSFAGVEALQVKAFSQQHPDRRLLDYFFIHGNSLHGILFSIEPKEKWEEYKHFVKMVADNFSFTGEDEVSN